MSSSSNPDATDDGGGVVEFEESSWDDADTPERDKRDAEARDVRGTRGITAEQADDAEDLEDIGSEDDERRGHSRDTQRPEIIIESSDGETHMQVAYWLTARSQ